MVDDFSQPYPVQIQGSRLARKLFTALGWHIAFDGLTARQGVLIVYPHTSNLDILVLLDRGVAA